MQTAFTGADFVIMLGAFPRKDGMERKDLLEKNCGIFKEQVLSLSRPFPLCALWIPPGNIIDEGQNHSRIRPSPSQPLINRTADVGVSVSLAPGVLILC
jgi:hypothetical protein